MHAKRFLSTGLIVGLLFACTAQALEEVATISAGRLERMEYVMFPDPAYGTPDAPSTYPYAEATFDFFVINPDPNFVGVAFLNVFAELDSPYSDAPPGAEWIVRNVPYFVPECVTSTSHSVWINPREFDNPSDPGYYPGQHDVWPGNAYHTWACLTDEQLIAPTSSDLENCDFSALPASVEMWGLYDTLNGLGQLDSQPLFPTSPPALASGIFSTTNNDRATMPDIAQRPLECGPTSAANSLRWLAQVHNFSDLLPTKDDDLVKGLMKAMTGSDARPFPGLSGDQLHDGKIKYAQEMSLPITVKGGLNDPNASGAKAFDFIKSEFDHGEDVEFLIGWPSGEGSHWVTVAGYKINGDRLFLTVHDPDDGKTGSVTWELDRDGNFIKPKGTMLWAVSESYVAPPPSTTPGTGG